MIPATEIGFLVEHANGAQYFNTSMLVCNIL